MNGNQPLWSGLIVHMVYITLHVHVFVILKDIDNYAQSALYYDVHHSDGKEHLKGGPSNR